MYVLTAFLVRHLAEIYLAYGFACVILTMANAARPHGKTSSLEQHLWLMGVFGLGYGTNEILYWSWREYDPVYPAWLDHVGSGALLLAYLALCTFGRRLLRDSPRLSPRGKRWCSRWSMALPLGGLLLGCVLSPNPWGALRTGARLFLGVPGAGMAAAAFFLVLAPRPDSAKPRQARLRLVTLLSGLSFLTFGLFAVYNHPHDLPALTWIPTAETLNQLLGFPVPLARAASFLVGIVSISLLLRQLNMASREGELTANAALAARTAELATVNNSLEERIRQRTEELQQANAQLEQEIAGHRQAEVALRESEERLRLALVASRQNLVEFDLVQRRFTFAADYARSLGYQPEDFPTAYSQWLELTHPEDQRLALPRIRAHLAHPAGTLTFEFRQRDAAGNWRWILARGSVIAYDADHRPTRLLGTLTDITERRQMDDRLRRTQRLESIGSLAGGIAHDLNNALMPLQAGVELLRGQVPASEADLLATMESSAKRSASMVRQLLVFAQGAEGRKLPVSPGALLEEMARFVHRTFPKNIQFSSQCSCPEAVIAGVPTQLHQVLLNLCVNARDAMPHGGTLQLEMRLVAVDAAMTAGHEGAQPGPHVLCTVRDTGSGIPLAIRERIFDPFFTTKSPDKGTGLGLSTVLGIVRGHAGFIEVQTQEQQGTSFLVYLPAADQEELAAIAEPQNSPLPGGQGQLVLLIDDEPAIRTTLPRMLQGSGYRFVTAANGADALTWLAQQAGQVQLLLVDMAMPGMDGVQLLRTIQQTYPGLPAVAMSGNLSREQGDELHRLGVHLQLAKPFSHDALLLAMHEALRQAQP